MSFGKTHISPFSQKALKYNIKKSGGKRDDITVIVAKVIEKIKKIQNDYFLTDEL